MRLNPDHQRPQPAPSKGEEKLYAFLLQSEWAANLGDRELVLEVIKYVADHIGIGNKADALLMELIARFEKAKGIEDAEVMTPEQIQYQREEDDGLHQ